MHDRNRISLDLHQHSVVRQSPPPLTAPTRRCDHVQASIRTLAPDTRHRSAASSLDKQNCFALDASHHSLLSRARLCQLWLSELTITLDASTCYVMQYGCSYLMSVVHTRCLPPVLQPAATASATHMYTMIVSPLLQYFAYSPGLLLPTLHLPRCQRHLSTAHGRQA